MFLCYYYSDLIKRANTWLASNKEIELKSCETITWSSTTNAQVNDTNIVHRAKSLSSHSKTKYLRGLRYDTIVEIVASELFYL